MSKVALAGALALLLFFIAWAWPRLAIRGVTVTRKVDPGTPVVGEAYEETFEVRRKGWVPAPWVEVRDLSQLSDYQPGRVISLGNELVRWKARGVYRRRGWMALGPTSLRMREPFGLFDREMRITQRTSILVYPRVRPVPDLMTPSAQQVGSSTAFGAWADYPPETGGVRDYNTGDSFGRIHWPLSAKHQRLMSKTFEQPLTTDLWILLEPHRAVRQDRLILDYLAVCTADGRTPLTQTLAWDRIRRLPRRAIAVITPSADPGWVRLLQAVRGRRSTLIVFYLDAASFGGPDQNVSFDLGQDVDLYVVRAGDDFARLVRTRDAIRIA